MENIEISPDTGKMEINFELAVRHLGPHFAGPPHHQDEAVLARTSDDPGRGAWQH